LFKRDGAIRGQLDGVATAIAKTRLSMRVIEVASENLDAASGAAAMRRSPTFASSI
jgi:hypothetical protein